MFDFLNDSAELVAPKLLGYRLVRKLDGHTLTGRIVEVEAYHQPDAASHSYRGKTPRTEVMFGPAGYAYVYFTYGMHYCMNVVTGPVGEGSAVLVRALEPLSGLEQMRLNRPAVADHELTNGPAKLCRAIAIDKAMNGHDLSKSPFQLKASDTKEEFEIVTSKRIGISKEKDKLWRFCIKDNPYVSH